MALVIDASVAVRWLLDLEGADRADAILQSGERLIAPDLVFPEITNAVRKAVAFAKTPAGDAARVLSRAGEFFDEVVPSFFLKDSALQIAIGLRHSAYDCFYLALAEQRDCQMVTADHRLVTHCAQTRYARRISPLLPKRPRRD